MRRLRQPSRTQQGALMPLVLLHGIAQETRTQESLLKLWSDSLAIGLDRAQLSLRLDDIHMSAPYYGRLLALLSQDEAPPTPRADLDADDRLRSASPATSVGESIRREFIVETCRKTGRRIRPLD